MTYFYDEIDPLDALYNAAREYPGGIPAIALRINVPVKTLQKKLSPAVQTHVLTYAEAIAVLELLDGVVPAAADMAIGGLMWRLNRMAIRLPSGDDVDVSALFAQVMQVFSDGGRLADDIKSALADDNRIDARELSGIEKDLQQVIEDLVTLRNEVREKHRMDMAAAGK